MTRYLPLLVLLVALAAPAGAQETPRPESGRQPEVDDNSAQGPVPAALPPPLARPPEGLERVEGSPYGRALLHLERADVLDALGIRSARRASGDSPCDVLAASAWVVELSARQARAQLSTAGALLAAPAAEAGPGDDVEARLASLEARLDDLEGELVRVSGLLEAGGCGEVVRAPVWLPLSDRAAVGGAAAVLLRVGQPDLVVWIDGAPVVASGPDGWAVAVVPAGVRRVCVAAASDAECADEVEVDAEMGRGFDLR